MHKHEVMSHNTMDKYPSMHVSITLMYFCTLQYVTYAYWMLTTGVTCRVLFPVCTLICIPVFYCCICSSYVLAYYGILFKCKIIYSIHYDSLILPFWWIVEVLWKINDLFVEAKILPNIEFKAKKLTPSAPIEPKV